MPSIMRGQYRRNKPSRRLISSLAFEKIYSSRQPSKHILQIIPTRSREQCCHQPFCAKANLSRSCRYKHAVIPSLIAPPLLRSVRDEIQEHLSFTPKETDIYRIFQSGDLANLDGLDDASLARLPSLLKLRDALYSSQFREYLSDITGAGQLSGKKTDMAINVYTAGCHLLCHDDVIGSRRVSYILYLTDPDTPWQAEWGGALRLYRTDVIKDKEGKEMKVPYPDSIVSIPPAFGQLSFFAVQPGESFHDVEEVYHQFEDDGKENEPQRSRMAISGWYHIPQDGEDGYEEGLEQKLAEKSSLTQLQGSGDDLDLPQPQWHPFENDDDVEAEEEEVLSEQDLDFLLKYMSPSYLTPDITEELEENFTEDSSLRLEKFFSEKFCSRIREFIEQEEKKSRLADTADWETTTDWKMARPPHKHRFLFQQPRIPNASGAASQEVDRSPLQEILEELVPSHAFKKWLSTVTGNLNLLSYSAVGRRFRRGQDYTLASVYNGENPSLEFTIGITPTMGWEVEEEEDEDEEDANGADGKESNGHTNDAEEEGPNVGGYEAYMAGDDDEEEDEDSQAGSDDGVEITNGHVARGKKVKADPAVYKAGDDDDDGILFNMPAGWNRMSLVLRDRGSLKFVKYVSRKAKGDRWDVTGEIEVEPFEPLELEMQSSDESE